MPSATPASDNVKFFYMLYNDAHVFWQSISTSCDWWFSVWTMLYIGCAQKHKEKAWLSFYVVQLIRMTFKEIVIVKQ